MRKKSDLSLRVCTKEPGVCFINYDPTEGKIHSKAQESVLYCQPDDYSPSFNYTPLTR